MRWLIWFAAAIAWCPCVIFASEPAERLREPVRALVESAIEAGDLPGAVVGLWHDGQWLLREAYGQRSVDPDEPMSLDTVFDMASITKPVATATSAMLLAQDGRLDLNARVVEILPEFTGQGRDDVRVWHLMTHTAGLIPDNALSDYQSGAEQAWQRLMRSEIKSTPGTKFVYSDVGFLLLGKIVEEVSGQSLKDFSSERLFRPLGMRDSGYVPSADLVPRIAPTEKRDGEMLRGQVHDPRAALLDGVAGHAGLFSTLDDIAIYAQMMLANGRTQAGETLLRPETIWTMTRPRLIETRPDFGPLSRTRGWDHHSPYSYNGGTRLSASAFGHGGFTGTVLWIDPDKNLFFVFLSNRLHPDGKGNVNRLAGKIATLAVDTLEGAEAAAATEPSEARRDRSENASRPAPQPEVLTGIDVLAARNFRDLAGKRVALVTNQTGIDRQGRSTLSLLASAPEVQLVALFSPEHGIEGKLDVNRIGDSRDSRLDVPIYSLYGETRRPKAEHMAEIDVLVYDIQDIGARFYTYIATMKNCLEACAEHGKQFVVLDRPNPIGDRVAGPMRDIDRETFVACHHLPVQHGMTVGELALLFRDEEKLKVDLTVVPVRNWNHRQRFDETGLWWINPSPNMRTLEAAMLYPGVGLLEMTNLSVGRGTDRPFQWLGAPWMDGQKLAIWLNAQELPGVRAIPRKITPDASKHANVECSGVQFLITDAQALDPVRLGFALAEGLHTLHGDAWESDKLDVLMVNREISKAVGQGASLEQLAPQLEKELENFRQRRQTVLLYD
jgi:uncharacterized protein YbbC (DUF1343 family)/CubicO group peptidase (beta-lactamase class C family)